MKFGAILLAGGRSARMGQNKALMPLEDNGPPLIEYVVQALRAVTDDIVLSTQTPETYAWLALPMVADRFPGGLGPLAGIEAGLTVLDCDAAWVVACDMPALVPAVLCALAAAPPPWDAVIPLNADQQPEPLCALYAATCLPSLRDHLRRHDLRLTNWLNAITTRYIPTEQIRALDPALQSFWNINTPTDWERFRVWHTMRDDTEINEP